MIGDLFDSPWKILIVAVVIIVLFGSAKLPAAARSLGKSMRILKSEMRDLHGDGAESGGATVAPAVTQQPATAPPPSAAQQLAAPQPQRLADLNGPADGEPAAQHMRRPG